MPFPEIGVDDLVVSAEAPTTDGYSYPSDAVLAQAVLDAAASRTLATRNIGSVYLHVWSTRGIFRLSPGEADSETVCGEPPFAEH